MYQPVRLYGAQRPGSPGTFCFLLCIAMGAFVILTLTAVSMFSSGEKKSLSSIFSPLEEIEVSLAFNQFIKEYGKVYSTEGEMEKRRTVFALNYRKITEFNKENSHMTVGVNKFADLTDEEFEITYLRFPPTNEKCTVALELAKINPPVPQTPDASLDIDWVSKGKVLPVKDQGNCGSCWTFAAIATIESIYAIQTNKLLRFSEQELVDCCRGEVSQECRGSYGCFGGLVGEGYDYATKHGIPLSENYPYHALDEKCKHDPTKAVFKLDGYQNITEGSLDEMEREILNQPIAVGIGAGYFAFRFYKSGVLDKGCPDTTINHGVTVVGAGTENINGEDIPYWKVRNSWGGNWGDQGYIKIGRNGKGMGHCSINACPQFPLYKAKN